MGEDSKGFDATGFFEALDSTRISRTMTWRQVAKAAGVSPSTLTRMSQGRRPDVDSLAALVRWADLSADEFVGREQSGSKGEPLAMISTYLRSDPTLSEEAASALDDIVRAAYSRLRKGNP